MVLDIEGAIDCHTHVGVDQWFYLNGYFPYGTDFRTLVEQGARHGVQRLLVFPCVSYFGWEGLKVLPAPTEEDDFSVPYAYENRRMLSEIFDLTSDYADRAIPFAIVDPGRQQHEQSTALRTLKKRYPIRGLKIQATVIQSPIRRLLDDGSCLLELAAEWNIPVLIHSSIAPSDIWSQTFDIMDVAERWPQVRFCLAHSCRFHLPSLERAQFLANVWIDCSAHGIHCDAAVANLEVVASPSTRLACDYRSPAKVMSALYELIPDKLIWGSDAPFYSYAASHNGTMLSLISTYDREVEALSALSLNARAAVVKENTVRFLEGY